MRYNIENTLYEEGKELKRVLKVFLSMLVVIATFTNLLSCGANNTASSASKNGEIFILNFGDYMAEEAIQVFENETGIRVHQDVFEANEEVIPVIESGAKYDVICISDYCIERMLARDLLQPIDISKVPNIENINKDKLKLLSVCDPGNKYAVPYFCGSMGIFFNKTKFDQMNMAYPTSWADLFNPELKGELLMQSSVRDLYTVALKMHGFSVNSTNKEELDICTEDFIKQKPYVQGYMTDQVKEKMLSGEAAIAPLTSGDVQYVYIEGGEDEYSFVVPKEGTQMFIDAWCIPKNATNVDNAHKFIDYMCREDVARINAEYVGYETVNDKTPDEDFLVMKQLPGAYVDYSDGNFELERDVADAIRYYTDGYNRIKAS